MATLASLLCANVRTCSVLDAENTHLFMLYLGVSNEKAIELLELNGRGCVYSSKGDTAKDWELMGNAMPKLRGECVFVSLGGKVTRFSKRAHERKVRSDIDARKKREHDSQYTIEAVMKRAEEVYEYIQDRKAERAEREERRRKRETEAIFEAGQTQPSPKRQGTGKSIAELGRFVNRPATRVNLGTTVVIKKEFRF